MHERISFNVYRHLGNVLDTLSEYDVSGTFFITGTIAEKHPKIPQKICKRGHEIASHGYSHKNLSEASYVEAEDEISKSIKVLSRFQDVKGFRAPFLTGNKATYLACEKLGLSYDSSEHGLAKYRPNGFKVTVLPVISPIDTHGLGFMRLRSKDLVTKWLHQCNKSNGATVCMHIWRMGRKRYIKAILEPLLKSDVSFVKAYNLLCNDGIALTFDVGYTSLGASLPATLLLWGSSVKDYSLKDGDSRIIVNREKEDAD